MEARAEGHHAGKVKLDGFGNVVTEEGRTLWIMVDLEGPDLDHLRKAKDADANAAQSVIAWNSYDAMRAALEGVIRVADRKTVEFDAARAALRLARGMKPEAEG